MQKDNKDIMEYGERGNYNNRKKSTNQGITVTYFCKIIKYVIKNIIMLFQLSRFELREEKKI